MKNNNDFINRIEFISQEYKKLLDNFLYQNSNKLYQCFKYWIELFLISKKLKIDLPLNQLDLFLDRKKTSKDIDRKKSKYEKTISILKNLKIKEGVFPFGSNYNNRIGNSIQLLTKIKINNINTTVNHSLKNKFILKMKSSLDSNLFKKLIAALPNEFFLNIINDDRLPRYYKGSMYTLISEKNIRILYLNKKIYLTGVQHGGCYGELLRWNTEEFEKQVSDKFFHWGLGANNIQQNRFSLKNSSIKKINKIFVIGTPTLQKIELYKTGFTDEIHKKTVDKRVKMIKEFVSQGKEVYLIKHPLQKYPMPENIIDINLQDINKKDYSTSLFIIDYCMHSFFYKAVYQEIPFIMFIDRNWHSYFSKKYSSLIDYLSKEKFLYYWDEYEKFILNIDGIIDSEKSYINRNYLIKNYLEKNIN